MENLQHDVVAAAANPIRVACVGDSITQGTEYPGDLWMLLGSNYTVGNFGVGGAAVSLDSGKPYMNQSAFLDAEQFKPNIVIIMLGTNDARPDYARFNASFVEDYIKLIDAFRGLGSNPQIWIVESPPIFNGTMLSPQYFVQYVIPNVETVAIKTGLPLINVYTPLINHPEYFPDGVHPDSAGSQIIATTIYEALTSQVNSNQTPGH